MVETPLVCVVQHDLAFLRSVDLLPVVELLTEGPERATSLTTPVNYVYFMRESQKNYTSNMIGRSKLHLGPPVQFQLRSGASLALTRLPQFFDGTHIARVDWYSGIFDRELLNGKKIKRGQFTDCVLGPFMLGLAKQATERVVVDEGAMGEGAETRVSQGVLDVCSEFGCWMWAEEDEPLICHLDGRKFMSRKESAELAASLGVHVRAQPTVGRGTRLTTSAREATDTIDKGQECAVEPIVNESD